MIWPTGSATVNFRAGGTTIDETATEGGSVASISICYYVAHGNDRGARVAPAS